MHCWASVHIPNPPTLAGRVLTDGQEGCHDAAQDAALMGKNLRLDVHRVPVLVVDCLGRWVGYMGGI